MCVQRFDDSLNSAIHITYRISLRSSSMPEPRDPLLKVLIFLKKKSQTIIIKVFDKSPSANNTFAKKSCQWPLFKGDDSPKK